MLEERRPGPAGGVRVEQNQHVFGGDRRSVRTWADRIEQVRTDEAGLEPVFIEITALHPADRQVDGVFRDAGGLGVGRQYPGVDAKLRDARGPFRQIGRTPVHVAEPHRLGVRKAGCQPAQLVSMRQQLPGLGKQCRTRRGEDNRPAVALEELHPEVSLQGLDLLGKRRTRDVKPLCGTAEVQLLGDGDEVAQLPQLHPVILVR